MSDLPNWLPIYDIEKTYLENADEGPFFDGVIPERNLPPPDEWVDFLGIRVASRIGVAAGPLLNSRWTTLASQLGYDILTYKTTRTHESSAHPLPNIAFVDAPSMLSDAPDPLHPLPHIPTGLDQLAITNSFGNPSRSFDYLKRDIPEAQAKVQTGQVLVVSVFGSIDSGRSLEEDFIYATRAAVELGVPIIEANFSCPNIADGEGALYQSPDAILRLGTAVVKAAQGRPVIMKMGALLDPIRLRAVLHAAKRVGFAAVSGINTIKTKLVHKNGQPALGPDRPYTGVCGNPIRDTGLQFVQAARQIIDRDRLDLVLIGVGGIVEPQHFDTYFSAGADFAQTATGMMWDPYLATRYHMTRSVPCTSMT